MSSKRSFPQEEDDDGSLLRPPKQSRLWHHCYRQVTSERFLESLLLQLVPLLRRLVQEEVQKSLLNYVYPAPSGDRQAGWSKEEFDSNIVSERDNRRPLLTGVLGSRMSNGVGRIDNATFTDNSSWTRSGKFRLGAVVAESRYSGGRVREAVTEAFKVKDVRVESNQKDHPPSLKNEVCCLKKIQKGGPFHKRLVNGRINTVQDFLRSYVMDPYKLRSLLGRRMPNKWWESTVKHALQCPPENKLYSYHIEGQGFVLVFNSIFELVGAKTDGLYHPLNALSASQKDLVNRYKKQAYKNPRDIVEFHDTLVDSLPRALPTMDVTSIPGSSLSDPHNSNVPATFHDVPSSQVGFQHQPYAPCNELSSDISQLGFHPLHQSASLQKAVSFRSSSEADLICASLSIPGSSSSPIPNVQATHHAEAANQVGSQVISSGQGFSWVQRSASFGTNSFNTSYTIDKQILEFESPVRTFCLEEPSMTDDEVRVWMAEMLQPSGGETSTICGPLSPHKWVQLIAVVKCMSIIKRSAARRARTVHQSHQAVVSSA